MRTRSVWRRCSAPRSRDTPTTSRGINDYLVKLKDEQGLDVPLHVDAASGGFVWPFLYPHTEWDFRLEQVRSINVSGHKFGLVYPGIGWLVFRESSDLPEDLVFYENYLGKRDATFTLNFSTGSAMVLAQYYNFVRYGHEGYRYIMETMQFNARLLAKEIAGMRRFHADRRRAGGAASAGRLPAHEEHDYDEFDVAAQLAAERGWMVPAYTLPPERRAREDHACARQANARALARDHARSGHRRSVRDPEEEGSPARVRPQARQDQHRVLTADSATPAHGPARPESWPWRRRTPDR